MFKLIDLLEISADTGFTTKQTAVDPETGKISWDVEYYADFSEVMQNLDRDIRDLQNAIKKSSLRDRDVEMSLKAMKLAKQKMIQTLRNKYPEYIKNY